MMLIRSFTRGPRNPLTLRRIKRFREIKRGYYSLRHPDRARRRWPRSTRWWSENKRSPCNTRAAGCFPPSCPARLKNKDFGITGESAEAPVNYRKLKKIFHENGKGTGDHAARSPTIPPATRCRRARARSSSARASITNPAAASRTSVSPPAIYDVDEAKIHLRYTLRNGLLSGPVDGWDARRNSGLQRGISRRQTRRPTATTARATKEDFLDRRNQRAAGREIPPRPADPGGGQLARHHLPGLRRARLSLWRPAGELQGGAHLSAHRLSDRHHPRHDDGLLRRLVRSRACSA